jgi:carbonic anhydrase
MCDSDIGIQAPLILKSTEAQKLSNYNYFFTQMNTNVTGFLNLEDFNNNLVLSFDKDNSMGTIYYNLENDDKGVRQYFFFNCSRLYFRLPGEHVIDGVKYDMELQFNCSGVIPGDKGKNEKIAFVAVPVKLVKNYETQSTFFDNFNKLFDTNSTGLGSQITINNFDEAFDSFNMYRSVFFYVAGVNYPQCLVSSNWIVIKNVLTVHERVYDKLFSMLDKNQIDDGNYRIAGTSTEYFMLESIFNQQ